MSLNREMRESLQNEKSPAPTTTESEKQLKESINAAIGITAKMMYETAVNDICMMIDKGQRYSLDGYALCLSRLMSHEKAFGLIQLAFQQKNETIPGKYKALFRVDKQTKPDDNKPHVAH